MVKALSLTIGKFWSISVVMKEIKTCCSQWMNTCIAGLMIRNTKDSFPEIQEILWKWLFPPCKVFDVKINFKVIWVFIYNLYFSCWWLMLRQQYKAFYYNQLSWHQCTHISILYTKSRLRGGCSLVWDFDSSVEWKNQVILQTVGYQDTDLERTWNGVVSSVTL